MVFTVKIKNSENHGEFCICNLGIKSHFNQAILNLATKFVQKVYFQFKSDKSHFCMSPWLLLTRVQLPFATLYQVNNSENTYIAQPTLLAQRAIYFSQLLGTNLLPETTVSQILTTFICSN